MEEIWKDIPGFDGMYQVSNLGRVRSIKIKATSMINSGYEVVSITKDKIDRHFLVHRLVAEAFCPNPRNCKTVNHKDENKLNNAAENLEWCTQAENNAFGTARERMAKSKSKPVACYKKDGTLVASYPSSIEAERQDGYDHSTIVQCCLHPDRRTYRGMIWKFI